MRVNKKENGEQLLCQGMWCYV